MVDALGLLSARSFADWSMLDHDEAGTLVRIAGAHRAPALEPLLREIVERYPARANPASPNLHVL